MQQATLDWASDYEQGEKHGLKKKMNQTTQKKTRIQPQKVIITSLQF